ncbi:pur operon repressor [Aerococcus christensenii]|uniref:Pur operon repressor n=1 Tax=Aerococcus christensenii TaxID=87541 RepID=A0A0X8F7D0_9LACT|nr:pur operon repressor [Aerococcus christensenii]AMB92180.1 transcriptional regulator [Aerococcus christensenii]KXB37724.1 pur operon repressor PurR [Aerococcus christensenii]MDK8233363.1 pur operon repressor [Aerococcus christensenii]PKY92092.1 pur operon repressor [Aerococcus christensenii]WEB70776.1 pur operon repressor [Aerococcus christensenii]
MKMKRSHRLVDMTHYLLNHPYTTIPLPFFGKAYNAAKSSISEDIGIIADQFKQAGIGKVETLAGASGGVVFRPRLAEDQSRKYMEQLALRLSDNQRILPGGYFYFSDILGNPEDLRKIGTIIASAYFNQEIDVIMTMATKGIPLAQAVAYALNVPFVVVQREAKLTEGSTVSVTYVAGNNNQVKKMGLTKNSLSRHQNILIVDDYMNVGGTMKGMHSLVKEFECEVVGAVVFAESDVHERKLPITYRSLIRVQKSSDNQEIELIHLGSLFDQ